MSDSTTASKRSADKAEDEQMFLAALGLRVRRRREAAGYTRKALAQHAGLSERYLAQLELGSGNVSMLLLRKLATALVCPLSELIEQDNSGQLARRPGIDAIVSTLRHLNDAQLTDVRELLAARYGEATALRRSRVALIGLRGAGKSTVGALLANVRSVPFIELDQEIERDLGSDLSGIFSLYGQDAYREAEARALAKLTRADQGFVLATGGSIVTAAETYAKLRSQCFTVWLSANPEDHMARVIEQGDMRPMRGHDHAMTELRGILQQREALYEMADVTLDTSTMTKEDIVAAISAALV